MQFPAKDGSMHPSQKQAFDAGSKPAAASSDDGSQPQPITDNPEAMQCIDKLQQMGYTADDVAQAMDADSGQDQSGQQATQAAPMQIPSMG
jgi:hypothetical protein